MNFPGTELKVKIVLAVAPHQLLRLLPDGAQADPFFARTGQLTSSPIVCVHAWFDREVTDAAFAGPAHVIKQPFVINRVTAVTMEPRNAVGHYHVGDDRYTVYTAMQRPQPTRAALPRYRRRHLEEPEAVPELSSAVRITSKPPPPSSLLLWPAAWELTGLPGAVDIFPPFHKVIGTLWTVLASPEFHKALGMTAEAWGIGLGCALLFGIPMGVLMGMSRTMERLFGMWVNIVISAPLTAVVPALMPLLGIGQLTVIVTVFLFSVFVIVIDTVVSLVEKRLLVWRPAVGDARP